MVVIYSTQWWAPCKIAKQLLDSKKVNYKEIDIEKENITRAKLHDITGGYTVPQIIINNNNIGGYNSLLKLEQNGELDKLLKW